MESLPYIDRLVREFNLRNSEHIEAHDLQLDSIFEQIRDLPSPQKEARLVELIVQVNCYEVDESPPPPPHREVKGSESSAQA